MAKDIIRPMILLLDLFIIEPYMLVRGPADIVDRTSRLVGGRYDIDGRIMIFVNAYIEIHIGFFDILEEKSAHIRDGLINIRPCRNNHEAVLIGTIAEITIENLFDHTAECL